MPATRPKAETRSKSLGSQIPSLLLKLVLIKLYPWSASVQLNGGASFDPDGDPLSFSWAFVSIPDGLTSTPEINNPDTATPSLLTSVAGEYVLELVIRDGEVNSYPSQVMTVAREQTKAQIDIRPGRFPNRIELEKDACNDDDEVRVAILTTPDLVATQVDASTLKLGDPQLSGTALPIRNRVRDVDLDGDLDLLLTFWLCDLITNEALMISSTELVLTGNTLEGVAITGRDSVKVVNDD